jgi:hypothetical protein
VIVKHLQVGILLAARGFRETEVKDDAPIHPEEVWELGWLKEHGFATPLMEVNFLEHPVVEGLECLSIEEAWYTH